MPRSSYPSGLDIKDRLESAGFTIPDKMDLEQAAADGIAEFERVARRVMLAGDSETRYFDPPGNREGIVSIDDVIGTPSVVWQPQGSSPTTWTAGTDYRLEDVNAAAKGRPYTILRLYRCGGYGDPVPLSYRGAVAVTGTFGYGATIPDDAWRAMALLGGLAVGQELFQGESGGSQSWSASAVGYSESFNPQVFMSLTNGWQGQADKIVSRYKKVTF